MFGWRNMEREERRGEEKRGENSNQPKQKITATKDKSTYIYLSEEKDSDILVIHRVLTATKSHLQLVIRSKSKHYIHLPTTLCLKK